MKLLVPIALTLSMAGASLSQTPPPGSQWSGSLYYDLKARAGGLVVLTNIDRFETLKCDLSLIAGATSDKFGSNLSGLAGFSLTWSIQPDPKLRIFAGPAVTWNTGSQISGGLILGAAVKF